MLSSLSLITLRVPEIEASQAIMDIHESDTAQLNQLSEMKPHKI
jgi:hypothetical protein